MQRGIFFTSINLTYIMKKIIVNPDKMKTELIRCWNCKGMFKYCQISINGAYCSDKCKQEKLKNK